MDCLRFNVIIAAKYWAVTVNKILYHLMIDNNAISLIIKSLDFLFEPERARIRPIKRSKLPLIGDLLTWL